MTNQSNLETSSFSYTSYIKPILIGAGIALIAISFFVFGVDQPNPEWPEYWRVRPLIITPLAGAVGGAFYAFLNYHNPMGINKTVAFLLSILIYIIGLWMGSILGLVGTMWN